MTIASTAPNKAQQIATLREEVGRLEKEIEDLRRRCAVEAPHVLEDQRQHVATEYSDKVPLTVQALAEQGYTEPEWIAELGISRQTWDVWVDTFPALAEAVEVARARFLAYIRRRMRHSIETGRNVSSNILKALEQEHEAGGTGGLGDASKLVRIDLRMPCPDCPQVAKDRASSEAKR